MIDTSHSSRCSLLFLSLLLRFSPLFTGTFDLRSLRHLLFQHHKLLALFLPSVYLLRHQHTFLQQLELLPLAIAAINRLDQHGASRDVEEPSPREESSGVSIVG